MLPYFFCRHEYQGSRPKKLDRPPWQAATCVTWWGTVIAAAGIANAVRFNTSAVQIIKRLNIKLVFPLELRS